MIRVLIPSFSDDLLEEFLASLERSEPGSSARVVVGDNGLSRSFCKAWPQSWYVPIPRPFVYAQAINACARAHLKDDLLILGDDMEMLSLSWVKKAEEFMAQWPSDYGALNLNEGQYSEPYRESSTAQGLGITLIPRAVWNRIGGFDERYVGYGFEDIDFCVRLWHVGLKVGGSNVLNVHHAGQVGSIRRLGSYEAVIDQCYVNFDLFYEKWGLPVPADRQISFIPAAEHMHRVACTCRA